MKEVGIQHLPTFSDSQLVVRQVKGKCEVREENMKKYLDKVKDLIPSFQSFHVQQAPREENARAGILSKLAASLLFNL